VVRIILEMIKKLITFFSLFGSLSTLLCCALPVTLVTIGMGATFASLTATFPQIIWITQNKGSLFLITGTLLLASYILMKRSEKVSCPIDVDQREVCQNSKSASHKLFWFTLIVYGLGLLFSYIIPKVLYGM
tara:strand:- start:811 stop:1206 length:396 start_codon:yes stop_codon:yes gene_type:complete